MIHVKFTCVCIPGLNVARTFVLCTLPCARARRSTLKINPLSEMCFFVSENIFAFSFSPSSFLLFLSLLTPSNVSFRHRKKIDSTFFAIFPMTMSRCASFDQADPLTVLLKLPARLSGGSFSRDTPRDRHSKCLGNSSRSPEKEKRRYRDVL